MHPIAFSIGDFSIHSYGLMAAIAFLTWVFVLLRRAQRFDISRDALVDVIFWSSLSATVGARALYVVANLDQFDSPGEWFAFRDGGLVFYGGLIGGLLAATVMFRRHKLPFYLMMDLAASTIPLGHGISRIGCFFAGCCYGAETNLPWAVTFVAEGSSAPLGKPLHPTQLYEVGWELGLFALLSWYFPRRRFDGQVMLGYLVLYATLRSINELFRADATRGYFLEGLLGQTLSTSQGISILVAVTALTVFLVGPRFFGKPTPTPEQPA